MGCIKRPQRDEKNPEFCGIQISRLRMIFLDWSLDSAEEWFFEGILIKTTRKSAEQQAWKLQLP